MAIENDLFEDDTDLGVLRGKAVSGAFYTGLSQAAKLLISFASQVILSRLLLPGQFGIVAMVAPVLAFASLFNNLGLSQAVIQRERVTQADLSALYWLGLCASGLCALGIIAASPLVALAYHQPAVKGVCVALACQLPIAAFAGHASALMSRKMRFGALAMVEVASALVGLSVSVTAAFCGAGFWALVIGQLSLTVTQAAGDRWLSGWRPSRPRWSPTVAPMLKFGANLTGFNLLSLFSLYSDNVLVGFLRGPASLGLFDKGFSLVLRPMSSITAPISRVATPLLARSVHMPEAYRRTYISLLQATVLLGAPGLLVGSIMSGEIVGALLGRSWAGAAPIITPLCIAAIFTAFSGSSYWLFTSQNRTQDQLRCGFISSGLILVSMLIGLPWGPVGIATSYAVFAPLVHGSFTWMATRRGPIRRVDIVRASYPLLIALACAAAIVLAVAHLSAVPRLLRIVVALSASYSTAAIVVLAFPQGRHSLHRVLSLRQSAA